MKICIFFGALSCIAQLICVQGCIIILNSLFDEIVEEFKLWFNNTQRVHNFYELLEINSYKELPEIDVAMITSSVGIIFLKNSGYICSNITFQLLSLICFLLIFLLFDFHKDDKLLENYTRLEIVVLVLSYIGLSFLVGCSSTISLKEFSDKYYNVYKKESEQEESDQKKGEKLLLFLFSGLSIALIILINRKIFISFDDMTSKWILINIIIICFVSFLISMFFYAIYLIPIISKEERINNVPPNNSPKEIKKENEDKDIQEESKEIDKKDNMLIINIVNTGKEYNTYNNSEMEVIKNNSPSPENNGQKKGNKKQGNENENTDTIYSTKICTLCGYIYLRKKSEKKSSCICYYYTSKCDWFKEMICNAEIIFPTLTELYCQVCIMDFNPILTEKLLNEYSYHKNLKFYLTLISISIWFGIVFVYVCKPEIGETEEEKEKKKDKGISKLLCFIAIICIYLLAYIIFTLVSSACYYADDNINRERWNNIIMTEFIFFKILDFQILTFFNFYDNSDIFNTTLAITLERLLWMIVETIIESLVENKKRLVLVQIIITSIPIGLFLLGDSCVLICNLCK